jgi:2Fe-2S ferredoxin
MEDNTITIHVKDREGKVHDIEAPTDMDFNVMEICKASELPVKGTCGGMALCSTCQVYVLSDHELSEMSEDEEDMLDQAFFVKDNSRLGCQLKLRDELDGLELELAPEPVL